LQYWHITIYLTCWKTIAKNNISFLLTQVFNQYLQYCFVCFWLVRQGEWLQYSTRYCLYCAEAYFCWSANL